VRVASSRLRPEQFNRGCRLSTHRRDVAQSRITIAKLVETPILKYSVIHGASARQFSHARVGVAPMPIRESNWFVLGLK